MSTPPTSPLLICGLPCSAFQNEQEVRQTLVRLIEQGTGGYSVAMNAEKLARGRRDPALQDVLKAATLAVPDGFMAVLALRWIHGRRSIKVDLPRCVLTQADAAGWRVAICGGQAEVNQAAIAEITRRYPGIKIVANVDGYQPLEAIRDAIVESAPDLALLAMGSPRQEKLAHLWHPVLGQVLIIGCGGALDILSGRVKRAPRFFVDNGLEWFYRLVQSPRRIRRQLVLPVALWQVLVEGVRQRLRPGSPANDSI